MFINRRINIKYTFLHIKLAVESARMQFKKIVNFANSFVIYHDIEQ